MQIYLTYTPAHDGTFLGEAVSHPPHVWIFTENDPGGPYIDVPIAQDVQVRLTDTDPPEFREIGAHPTADLAGLSLVPRVIGASAWDAMTKIIEADHDVEVLFRVPDDEAAGCEQVWRALAAIGRERRVAGLPGPGDRAAEEALNIAFRHPDEFVAQLERLLRMYGETPEDD